MEEIKKEYFKKQAKNYLKDDKYSRIMSSPNNICWG